MVLDAAITVLSKSKNAAGRLGGRATTAEEWGSDTSFTARNRFRFIDHLEPSLQLIHSAPAGRGLHRLLSATGARSNKTRMVAA